MLLNILLILVFQQDLFAWGYNIDGQLGNGSFDNQASPQKVENLHEPISIIDCSKFSSGAITTSNKLYTWGSMKQGALGFDFQITSKSETVPRELSFFNDKPIADFSMGDHHAGVVLKDGSVYTWGYIQNGKLGHSKKLLDPDLDLRSYEARSNIEIDIVKEPQQVESISDIQKIHCSSRNTFLIDKQGQVYVLGAADKGISGLGRRRQDVIDPTLIQNLQNDNIDSIQCGSNFCLALNKKGQVYSWGLNNYGQLGDGSSYIKSNPSIIPSLPPIQKVHCGEYFSMALSRQGEVYSWGNGNFGQLGHGNKFDAKNPIKIKFEKKVKDISCGDTHSTLLTEDGEVYCFGNGKEGQMGRDQEIESSASYRTEPQQVTFFKLHNYKVNKIQSGGYHTFAEASTF